MLIIYRKSLSTFDMYKMQIIESDFIFSFNNHYYSYLYFI